MTAADRPRARAVMVEREVAAKGVRDPRVLAAMTGVPRHRFVPEPIAEEAYGKSALPIGHGQTISAPYIVGLMTEALELTGEEKVLEVGTGSGYQAAVLAQLTPRVLTVERIPELAAAAADRLDALGLSHVVVKVTDGSLGYREEAPYDRILVAAAAPRVPEALLEQLTPGGMLVAPVGSPTEQILVRVRRRGDTWRQEELCRCVFVPLLGRQGFEEGER